MTWPAGKDGRAGKAMALALVLVVLVVRAVGPPGQEAVNRADLLERSMQTAYDNFLH